MQEHHSKYCVNYCSCDQITIILYLRVYCGKDSRTVGVLLSDKSCTGAQKYHQISELQVTLQFL